MTVEQLEMMIVAAAGAAYATLVLVNPAALRAAHWSHRKRITIAVLALVACVGVALNSVVS